MQIFRIFVLLALALSLSGCGMFGKKKSPDPKTGEPAVKKSPVVKNNRPVITAPQTSAGKISMVNMEAKFAVISYPFATSAPSSGKVNIYRKNVKVGEIRITGPSKDNNTVGDILNGEVLAGDEVRTD